MLDRCTRCGRDGAMQANCECAHRRYLCGRCTFEEHKAAGSACPTECPVCGVEYDGALLFASAHMWMKQIVPEAAHAFASGGFFFSDPSANDREVGYALAARAKFAYAMSVTSTLSPAYTERWFETVLSDMIRILDNTDALHLRTHLHFVAHLGRRALTAPLLFEAECKARLLLRACERSRPMAVNLDLAPAVLARIIINGRSVIAREAGAEAIRDAEAEALLLRCAGPREPENARMLGALYMRQGRFAEATAQARVALRSSRLRFGDAHEVTTRDLEMVKAISRALVSGAKETNGANGANGANGPVPPACAVCGCSDPRPKRCAGCRVTRYCGSACQVAHRPEHRKTCSGRVACG